MADNNEKYAELRRRYPLFEYVAFRYELCPDGLRLQFHFRMGDVEFKPVALVEHRPFLDFGLDKPVLDRLVFDIGMAELVSYWKCACPPTVRVLCGDLTAPQAAFWKKLYWYGLGEFFYTNGISPGNMPDEKGNDMPWMTIEGVEDADAQLPPAPERRNGGDNYLVPVGGGKDSVVTLELLRRAGRSVRPLVMNPRGATRECARVAGFPMDEVLVLRRSIDPALLALNRQGFLNGHTPFSAMLAFYTRLASALSGISNVALSNESSANESTVRGSHVNHQYSKCLEFEDDFRAYCHAQAPAMPPCNYFSFLRPLSELQIAMLFSRFTRYHDVFRSCNAGSKEDVWCGRCAKCLFAYIILSPFIAPARLNAIFGKAMLDDRNLRPEFLQLTGLAATKPFECVGTVDEVRQALAMTIRRWYPDARPSLLAAWHAGSDDIKLDLCALPLSGNLTDGERAILLEACTENPS